MATNDGGPAFPVSETDPVLGSRVFGGMSLRDWFAVQIACGYEGVSDERTYGNRRPEHRDMTAGEWQNAMLRDDAEYCYRKADAMLAARDAS